MMDRKMRLPEVARVRIGAAVGLILAALLVLP